MPAWMIDPGKIPRGLGIESIGAAELALARARIARRKVVLMGARHFFYAIKYVLRERF